MQGSHMSYAMQYSTETRNETNKLERLACLGENNAGRSETGAQRPPLISPAPVRSSMSVRTWVGAVAVVESRGLSPHPQSYVSSRCAQSNSGLPSRALTWLCTWHNLGQSDGGSPFRPL
jgi:hypothetical protein